MQMLHSFFSSWELFHNTYLAGWLIGLALSVVGVIVVAQDQIFIGAAVAQASTLGVALGMWVGSLDPAGGTLARVGSDSALSFMAVLFSIAAALITGLVGKSGRAMKPSRAGYSCFPPACRSWSFHTAPTDWKRFSAWSRQASLGLPRATCGFS